MSVNAYNFRERRCNVCYYCHCSLELFDVSSKRKLSLSAVRLAQQQKGMLLRIAQQGRNIDKKNCARWAKRQAGLYEGRTRDLGVISTTL